MRQVDDRSIGGGLDFDCPPHEHAEESVAAAGLASVAAERDLIEVLYELQGSETLLVGAGLPAFQEASEQVQSSHDLMSFPPAPGDARNLALPAIAAQAGLAGQYLSVDGGAGLARLVDEPVQWRLGDDGGGGDSDPGAGRKSP